MGSEYDRVMKYDATTQTTSKVEWDNMPASHVNDAIEYRVAEEPIDGYTATVTGDQAKGFVVTNTHEPGTVTIHAAKEWDDNNNADHLRPASVTMHLIATTEVGWQKDMGTAKAYGPDWKTSWGNMPTHHDGNEITYSVVEEGVDGYYIASNQATDNDGRAFKIVNKRTEPVTEVTATKVWMDDDNRDGKREDIQLRLEVRNKNNEWEVAKKGDEELTQVISKDATGDALTVTWSNLPSQITVGGQSLGTQSTSEGKSDSAEEEQPKEGDDQSASNSSTSEGQAGKATEGEGEPEEGEGEQGGSTEGQGSNGNESSSSEGQTNASSSTTGEGNGNGESRSNANSSNQEGMSPAGGFIGRFFSLFAPRKALADDTVAPQATLINAIYRVVEYHKNSAGEWVEGAPDGYVAVISQNESGKFTVTNIHQPEMRSFTVRKVWDTKGDNNATKPTSIEVQLLADGKGSGDPATLTGDEWTHTWTDLYRYQNGKEIEYTAEELEVPAGYTSTGQASGDVYVITNVYNSKVTPTCTTAR